MIANRFPHFIAFIAILAATASAEESEVSLSKDLMPLFRRSCAVCHQRDGNKDALKSGFLFERKKEVLDGVGKIIIPGKPKQSYMLYLVTPPEDPKKEKRMMPPAESDAPAMSKEEIQQITDWIQAGAKDN